jgi:hypothetical protein
MATQFPAPPVRTPFPDKQWTANGGKTKVDEAGYPSWGWIKWFQEIAAAFNTGTGTGLVTSVFGRSGAVVAVSGDYNVNQVTGAAPTNSPAFTGSPSAPTQAPGDNTTKIATDAFVQAAIAAIVVSSWSTTAKSANYNAVANDMVLGNTSGGGFTVTLPLAAANLNKSIRVKKTSADVNTLTIARSGGDLIDGATTQVITFQYTDIEMISDGGTNWWIA